MEALLNSIRLATSTDASAEARARGAAACRSILATLEPRSGEPTSGEPHAAAGPIDASQIASMVGMLRGVPADQLLDLAIAKLRAALPADVVFPSRPATRIQLVPLPPNLQARSRS